MAGEISLTRFYFDAPYVAKCYLEEPDSARVRELVRGEVEMHTSAFELGGNGLHPSPARA